MPHFSRFTCKAATHSPKIAFQRLSFVIFLIIYIIPLYSSTYMVSFLIVDYIVGQRPAAEKTERKQRLAAKLDTITPNGHTPGRAESSPKLYITLHRMMSMSRTKTYTSFADLNGLVYTPNFKHLTLSPRRRTYLTPSDAVYDFTVGHEFVVSDSSSPFDGCIVSCLDKRTLQQHGYTHANIRYNIDHSVEVKF